MKPFFLLFLPGLLCSYTYGEEDISHLKGISQECYEAKNNHHIAYVLFINEEGKPSPDQNKLGGLREQLDSLSLFIQEHCETDPEHQQAEEHTSEERE